MLRVIKLGGSLLDRRDFVVSVTQWLSRQPPANNWIIVGGGTLVESMREFDRRFELDVNFVHWQCIELLRATWAIVGELFPHWQKIGDPDEFLRLTQQHDPSNPALIAVSGFYFPGRSDVDDIPLNWDTTSDSLAALLAVMSCADELVILKSCAIPLEASPEQLSKLGILDPAFSRIASRVPSVRIEQLTCCG